MAKKTKSKKSKKATPRNRKSAAKPMRAKAGAKTKKAKKSEVSAKPAKRAAKKSVKKTSAKKLVANRKPATAKAAAKSTPSRGKDVMGEGNYTASRNFRKEETAFVQRNKKRIPQMGKEAEAALDGPQGDELRSAEREAASHAEG